MGPQTKSEYWRQVWRRGVISSDYTDKQASVLRVRNGKSIDEQLWEQTLAALFRDIRISKEDRLLDFCCGNGLIALPASKICKAVHAVDINEELVASIATENCSIIDTQVADAMDVEFGEAVFDKIVIYAAIQYFDDAEIAKLLQNFYRWLRPGGTVFIGDIPDRERLWTYFYNEEGERRYFDGVASGQPLIGNWIDQQWLSKLASYCGFGHSQYQAQDARLIYADFRYDFILTK